MSACYRTDWDECDHLLCVERCRFAADANPDSARVVDFPGLLRSARSFVADVPTNGAEALLARIDAALAASESNVPRPAYWLVERGSPAEWLLSRPWSADDVAMGSSDIPAARWTPDSAAARHFKTREEAAQLIRLYPDQLSGASATEHLDCDVPPVVDIPETDPLAVKPRSQLPILEALQREYEWRYAPQLNDEDELESAAVAKAAIEEITRLRAALADVPPKIQCPDLLGLIGHLRYYASVDVRRGPNDSAWVTLMATVDKVLADRQPKGHRP